MQLVRSKSMNLFELYLIIGIILIPIGILANIFIDIPEDNSSKIAGEMIQEVVQIDLELYGPGKGRYFINLSESEDFNILIKNFTDTFTSEIHKESSGQRIFDLMPRFTLRTKAGNILYINMYIDYDEPRDVRISFGEEEVKHRRKYYYDEKKYWITMLDLLFETASDNNDTVDLVK